MLREVFDLSRSRRAEVTWHFLDRRDRPLLEGGVEKKPLNVFGTLLRNHKHIPGFRQVPRRRCNDGLLSNHNL